MALVRRHFNHIAQSFRQTRAALLRAKVSAVTLTAFDQCVLEVAEQLASAAGTFDKARFLAEVRGEHTTRKEPANV